MKVLAWVRNIFLLVGLGLVGGAVVWGGAIRSFIARADVAPGRVVALERSSSGDSNVYSPVVEFVTPDGQKFEIRSSVASSPPAYSVGERVEVLYLPEAPQKARIRGILMLWLGPMILGGVGLIFCAVGGGMALARILRARRNADLRQNGTPVPTAYHGVRFNTSLRVNGRHPYQVITQWLNPATGKMHVFHSENLWFDPAHVIDRQEITVYLDRGNPRRYWMDVSFLPQVAD